MKRLFSPVIVMLLLLCSLHLSAQSGKVPPFRMIQPDGNVFRAQDLPMGKPIIMIYFSTECDDCLQMIMNLLARMDEFNTASIAMITYFPVQTVADFVTSFYLDNYSNIYVGTEGTSFFVRDYYSISELPFIALYTKEGNQVKRYYDGADLDDLAEQLDNL